MEHLFPSHKVAVEIIGANVPAPFCLRFSVPEILLPSSLPGWLLFILQKVGAQCHLLQEALPSHWFLSGSPTVESWFLPQWLLSLCLWLASAVRL